MTPFVKISLKEAKAFNILCEDKDKFKISIQIENLKSLGSVAFAQKFSKFCQTNHSDIAWVLQEKQGFWRNINTKRSNCDSFSTKLINPIPC